MADFGANPLVWVRDNAGNRFLSPFESLRDPKSISEAEKLNRVDDASQLVNQKKIPGEGKLFYTQAGGVFSPTPPVTFRHASALKIS